MTERQFQTRFSKWVKYNIDFSAAFEFKVVKNEKFYLSQIKEHQIRNLKTVSCNLLYYKIEDTSFHQKPFDAFTLYQVPSYVVIMWDRPRNNTFYLIPIIEIERHIKNGAKYMVEDWAKEHGIIGTLKNYR